MQSQENIDSRLVDSFRNQLFGAPGSGGLDLAALNIQRGRDHGLASYNAVREAVGLDRKNSFADISTDPTTRANLETIYSSVDQVDLWVGALSEDHLPGMAVGELAATVIARQFTQLAEGDRYFFKFDPELDDVRDELLATRLSDVLIRNSNVQSMQANAFLVPEHQQQETEFAVDSETGDVTLSIAADPERTYRLQRSTELTDWITIASDLKGEGKVTATDPGAFHTSRRLYYRFVEQ